MTFCVGSSLCKKVLQSQFDTPPPKPLLPTYPWSSPFPSRHPPLLVPGCQASSLLCLSFCCSTVSDCVLPPSIGLVPPVGQSSTYPIWKLHTCPHAWWRPLSWGPCCCQQWGRQSQLGARLSSEHQVVRTVASNCRSGGIIGVCYFSQMRWPVSFLVFSQLPDHVHNRLVWSLYQPISLGVVRHGPQLFDAKDLVQFFNYVTGEAGTSIP